VTVGLAGERLAELATMARSAAGVRVFSDDGHCVADPLLMRRALEYSTALDCVVAQHAEEPRLTVGAQAHDGARAARLGLVGWPAAAEEAIVARDCLLAAEVGARLHICHVSTSGTADVLRWAKNRTEGISAEVTPHHLLLTDERLATYDPANKVNPPLRTEADVAALRTALADGVIDCVATDHAPHAREDKEVPFEQAAMGTTGLETAFAALHTELVLGGALSLGTLVERLTGGAGVMGLPVASIAPGEPANLVLVDLDAEWQVGDEGYESRSESCCFAGRRLIGRVLLTIAYRQRQFALTAA
jgi:dihydroorotase